MRTRARGGQRGEERRESWGEGEVLNGRQGMGTKAERATCLKSVVFKADVVFPQGYSEGVTGPELQHS